MSNQNPLPTPHGSTAGSVGFSALPGYLPAPGQQHGSGTQSAGLSTDQHAHQHHTHTNNNNTNSSWSSNQFFGGDPTNGGAYYGAAYSPLHH